MKTRKLKQQLTKVKGLRYLRVSKENSENKNRKKAVPPKKRKHRILKVLLGALIHKIDLEKDPKMIIN